MYFRSLTVALLAISSAVAAPSKEVVRRQSVSPLSGAQINAFTPYTWFASAAYCNPSVTLTWACGSNCIANPGFQPTASGGDGDGTQFWYVGYDPSLNTVIVAHQGTQLSELLSVLTDVNVVLENLDQSLFPGVSRNVEVHNGFASEQASTASHILAAVNSTLSVHGINSVTTVGHSLGAALSLLDSVYLPLHIPGIHVTFYGYGLPRVGNQAFANYVDSTIGSFTRITNLKDPVPIVPGRFLGYYHPSNEAHISENGDWESCPGQDNPSTLCSVGDTPNIFESDENNHDGPYNGIDMGCS